jgi:hypothetical protein
MNRARVKDLENQKYIQKDFGKEQFLGLGTQRTQLLLHMARMLSDAPTSTEWGKLNGAAHDPTSLEQHLNGPTLVYHPIQPFKGTAREMLLASHLSCPKCGKCRSITMNGFTKPKPVIGTNGISYFVSARYYRGCNKHTFTASGEDFQKAIRSHVELAFVERSPVSDRKNYTVTRDLVQLLRETLVSSGNISQMRKTLERNIHTHYLQIEEQMLATIAGMFSDVDVAELREFAALKAEREEGR